MYAGIANPRWREKCSRLSRRMRNPYFYVSGKRPNGVDGSAASIYPAGVMKPLRGYEYKWEQKQQRQIFISHLSQIYRNSPCTVVLIYIVSSTHNWSYQKRGNYALYSLLSIVCNCTTNRREHVMQWMLTKVMHRLNIIIKTLPTVK